MSVGSVIMGFLDKIFKQKWKDEDPQIRLEAVKKLSDEKILINILMKIARNLIS